MIPTAIFLIWRLLLANITGIENFTVRCEGKGYQNKHYATEWKRRLQFFPRKIHQRKLFSHFRGESIQMWLVCLHSMKKRLKSLSCCVEMDQWCLEVRGWKTFLPKREVMHLSDANWVHFWKFSEILPSQAENASANSKEFPSQWKSNSAEMK